MSKIKIESSKIALVVGGSICLMIVLYNLTSIPQGWPGFLPTLFFIVGISLVGPKMYSYIKDIFIGAFVGLIFNYIQGIVIGLLVPYTGALAATVIVVFVVVWIIMVLGDISQTAFNNYTFIYWLLASAMPAELQTFKGLLTMCGTLIIGGLIFMALVVTFLRLWKLLPDPIPKNQQVSTNNDR